MLVYFHPDKNIFSEKYTTHKIDYQRNNTNTNLCDSKKSCTFAANFQTQVL